ncbi:centrosomal protein of 192 kDa [Periophthalmus magnuspinnatus]|uniref:centrosomal protein of 192 kDa n=1 Tax=Periophthalmus magnuspinnatus TaxID=409849 RepID=UPI00145A5403|nr:centrosomal protein of 192 kDa [Periophthalmus magnuspinnatus]
MADSFYKLEDEAFPSFLYKSLDSTSGRATLENVTLGSGPGLPVAASTVAKIRPAFDNRRDLEEASYLEGKELEQPSSHSSVEQAKFSLNFKDDMDNADDFIAAHRMSDMLVKINLDESASRNQASLLGPLPTHPDSVHGRPTELATDLSSGLLTFAHSGHRDGADAKVGPLHTAVEEDKGQSEGVESDHFSGSNSSFLANEKLMSVDSMNSDLTDDDLDLNNLPEDELDQYFNKLVPPDMQRGRVEGQEIPTTDTPDVGEELSNPDSSELDQYRQQFLDDYQQDNFQMPDVRVAATGMDSCPASDEDTEDELEAARRKGNTRTRLLPSTSRQLVGESHHPSFRPGLEGGSSDDEESSSQGGPSMSGLEHRRSAEGQVINPPITGDGGGGDGSSGSEESGNDGGVSTMPLPAAPVQTTYDVFRGLGIVGEDQTSDPSHLQGLMGDRVGPVGTGEASSSDRASATTQRVALVNWSMTVDRQEALDAMEHTGPTVERLLDSLYLHGGPGSKRFQDSANMSVSNLQGVTGSFHLSQVGFPESDNQDSDEGIDEPDGCRQSLGLRGGPCGNASAAGPLDSASDDDHNPLSTSLEPKYFSQSLHQDDSDDSWTNCPENVELEFQQGAKNPNSVVYQNEQGQWVTDLAYYSSFEKEVGNQAPENLQEFQNESFVAPADALEKIAKDQEEFEKEHQFMQEEKIEPAPANTTFQSDSSWKLPSSNYILMRASQVSDFSQADQSYLRLSLGQFFGQRSEALGHLGQRESVDDIKRPSFGYVITSPEKREPFALIPPSDLADPTHHNRTVDLEADRTLNPEDLDKTLEAPKEAVESETCKQQETLAAPPNHSEDLDSNLGNQSCVSLDSNSSNLMLSISTIASAIADASISTDPSQLAAMIMELSKRGKSRPEAKPIVPNTVQQAKSEDNTPPVEEQSIMMEMLQKSAFDMDKYLKKSDLSVCSDASLGQTTFDLTGWADNISTSLNNAQKDSPDQQEQIAQIKRYASDNIYAKASTTLNTDFKRSSIPCSCTSYSSQTNSGYSGPSSTQNTQVTDVSVKAKQSNDHGGKMLTVKPQAASFPRLSLEKTQNKQKSPACSPSLSPDVPRSSSGWRKAPTGQPNMIGVSSSVQNSKSVGQEQGGSRSCLPIRSAMAAPLHSNVEKHVGFTCPTSESCTSDKFKSQEAFADETHYNFRPSTSPLTQSSPSQTSFPSAESMASPSSSRGAHCDRLPDYSPQSICSSPGLSRLTYISMNDGTLIPSPEKKKHNDDKNDRTMSLSTTIIRFSPTPPVEPDVQSSMDNRGLVKSLDQAQPHSKSLDPLPPQNSKSPCGSRSGSVLGCSRTQSECNYQCSVADRAGNQNVLTDSNIRQLTKVDSGYCSNFNLQHSSSTAVPQGSQPWAPSSMSSSMYGANYVPIPSFKPQCSGLVDLPPQGDLQSLLAGRSLFTSHLPQQYLGPEVALHPSVYHMKAGNGLYGVPSSVIPNNDLTMRPGHSVPAPLGLPGVVGADRLRPLQSQQELGLMGKPYSQFGTEAFVGGLEDLRGQVVVPDELRFPNACCMGIASQTSLSLFNPSERWQQVSITLTSLSIDGEKVDALPYQWLIVKNKTIIGPKTTEEQKVLFIPPQPGVYQCVLSVCSWPASAESETAARAKLFAKRVVLVAIAENPAIEVELGKAACLDFGDLPVGGAKSLTLKLLNRTHATVPIRLVLSANATAWRCFSLSKNSVTMTCEATQQAGHITPMSPPAVMNHVMHASYGENPESFVVWVHFQAPSKYTSSTEELGVPDEFVARVDIEVDSPGPTHVIRSIPLRARSGTARVHAPKDLQTVSLTAPVGKSSQQMLPLKNAGNIDVQLKLKCSESDGCFSVTPNELSLKVGEERSIVISFKAQENRKAKESLLTILVLPSGPQYEVTLKGEFASDISGKQAISSSYVLAPGLVNDVPPILSNKQFVAWGGVTLGRAIQQKLVLRNNSKTETQQLRLLIRGQDQDCFQLQSMFSPEERLTRHGELSIRPREDVTVHLLFAPTRVACMMAKLEIKQSGVRPSQPGIKFTIPLSGYGGTSNIILEDQRKQADGYVATLTDVAVGRVSKVCLCVRNTGSRAAFIKAVVFSDIHKRATMEGSVISIAPSQFVLKERTQEVITILMKSTQRELSLCQLTVAQLATLCLFCGDEVSRQQYRKLLQSKPEAARKALSENSLLKNIEFNEKFLGEEIVTETYDLPLRPNEAHLFYGNMSKVVVCLMGSTKGLESSENSHSDESLPSSRRSSATDGGLTNGNVSLDVLPVKGPQGIGLKVPEPSLKGAEPLHKPPESWTIHPEQLLLPAPTINGPSTTSTVQIRNNSTRELSFDLSWPAHCLTITPQHGVIEPQCHLQILISPNPSLANKSSLLPWSGKIYVQCDGQQKFIKVQIRQDLVLDVSATTGDPMLSALPPQAATPVVHLPRGPTKPLMSTQPPVDLVKIRSKTVVFPITVSGEMSEAQLEVENGDVDLRWYLSSFAPPYVKGVDTSGDVYRATYTAFRCSKVSGTLGAHEKMQVPITFLPRDRGEYAQFWDLECHPLSEPQQKTRLRFQLCGTSTKSGPVEGPQEGDCSLVKTEPTIKKTKVEPTVTKPSTEEAVQRGVYSPQDLYTFPATRVGESSSLKVNIRNNSADTHELKFVSPREPFHIKHSKYSLRSQHYLKLPVQFKPSTLGSYAAVLLIQSGSSGSLVIQLSGEAVP